MYSILDKYRELLKSGNLPDEERKYYEQQIAADVARKEERKKEENFRILIIESLLNNHITQALEIIENVQFDAVRLDDMLTFFAKILNVVAAKLTPSNLRKLIASFETFKRDNLSVLLMLIVDDYLESDAASACLNSSKPKNPIDFYDKALNSRLSVKQLEHLTKALKNAEMELSTEDLEYLIDTTADDKDIHEYFSQLLDDVEPVIPSWVRYYEKEDLPDLPTLPPVHEAVQMILKQMSNKGIEPKNVANFATELASQYAISLYSEKCDLLKESMDVPDIDDIGIFREYGPVNMLQTTADHEDESICSKYGGCRMLLCNCSDSVSFAYDDLLSDYDYQLDWFTGECAECDRSISRRHHSVRKPLLHGGWEGCFCSIECVTAATEENNNLVLIGRIKEQLETVGIRDR